ncbi:MAG: hypothetical protein ACNS63_13520 [Candidatus Nitrospinota bacterium M3_3B_026]
MNRTKCSGIRMTIAAVLIAGAAALPPGAALAASCCGGGSAASLVLPKFSKSMLDVSFDAELYDGYWDKNGDSQSDPPGSDLRQYRLNLGYAKRLADRWQASVVLPYVWNDNEYANSSYRASGPGDIAASVWYEAFDDIRCVWSVKSWDDLKPAAYFGATLTLPTGVSPYDDVGESFNVTGRGFYRLDATVLLDKTVYPWNVSFQYSYGVHFERPVNREYGGHVKPYHKKLGDRRLWTFSGGYTHFMESMKSLTATLAYSDLWEGEGTIDGVRDPATGIEKRSVSATLALATMDRAWVYKLTYNHAIRGSDWGENFPITDIFTIGVSHVFH